MWGIPFTGSKLMNKFNPKVIRELKHYVYAYVDPRDDRVFYIGKGKGNRAFAHLGDTRKSEKHERIEEIRSAGLEPRIEIIRHGLTDEEALIAESVAIDLLGVQGLANTVRGHESRTFGRMNVTTIAQLYDAKEVEITEDVVLINISRSFRHEMSSRDLYEYTRGEWKIGPRREKAEYAFAVFHQVVQEVYKIQGWYPARSIYSERYEQYDEPRHNGRWEFVGHPATKLRKKYIGKSVAKYMSQGAQNPIRFENCGK
jgi:hypothetical protein